MSVLLGAMIPYAAAATAIVLFWRFVHGRRPYLQLAIIFLVSFAIWHTSNATLLNWQMCTPRGVEEWIATVLLYSLGVHFFLGNYTCIGQDSPSMTLVSVIDDAGTAGCTREDILNGFRERGHVEGRVDAMAKGGLVHDSDGLFTATSLGKLLRWCFDTWFALLGHVEVDDD